MVQHGGTGPRAPSPAGELHPLWFSPSDQAAQPSQRAAHGVSWAGCPSRATGRGAPPAPAASPWALCLHAHPALVDLRGCDLHGSALHMGHSSPRKPQPLTAGSSLGILAQSESSLSCPVTLSLQQPPVAPRSPQEDRGCPTQGSCTQGSHGQGGMLAHRASRAGAASVPEGCGTSKHIACCVTTSSPPCSLLVPGGNTKLPSFTAPCTASALTSA